jgi:uncharacterized protein
MTTEVRPLGEACQLVCDYCYQEPVRYAHNLHAKYDMDKMIEQIDKANTKSINFFGGEILLVKEKDLEFLFDYAHKKFGSSSIQTNGALINDNHIRMFKQYNVTVGISIDGPNELNGLRKLRRDPAKTHEATAATMANISKIRDAGLSSGIIITLHRENCSPDRFPRLLNFIRWLGDIGIKGGNIHTLEEESTMSTKDYVLTPEENIDIFLKLAQFMSKEENKDLQWNPFAQIKGQLLANDDDVLCYWRRCDPLNTQAVHGIEGDGTISNCGRTNKEGINWTKAPGHHFARYISFYNTPTEMGGCQGCRFWSVCGGSCPGEAIDGDFRNKTTHCAMQKAMLTHYENELVEEGYEPFTLSDKLPIIEKLVMDHIFIQENISNQQAMDMYDKNKKAFIQVPVIP